MTLRLKPSTFLMLELLWFTLFILMIVFDHDIRFSWNLFYWLLEWTFLALPAIYAIYLFLCLAVLSLRRMTRPRNWSWNMMLSLVACLLALTASPLSPWPRYRFMLGIYAYLWRHETRYEKQLQLIKEAKGGEFDSVVSGVDIRVEEGPFRVAFLQPDALMAECGFLWDPSGKADDIVRHIWGHWYYVYRK